jgi:hypothetical protein
MSMFHTQPTRALAALAVLATLALGACDKTAGQGPKPRSLAATGQHVPAAQGSVSPTTPMNSGSPASAPRTGIEGRQSGAAKDGVAQGSRGERTPGSGVLGGLAPSNPTTPSGGTSTSPDGATNSTPSKSTGGAQ